MSFFKKKNKFSLNHFKSQIKKETDVVSKPLTKPLTPLKKTFKPIEKIAKKEVKQTVKAGKFLAKPKNLVIEGEIAQIAGDVLIPLGGATGQPELVAAGVGLKAGGKKLKTVGKAAQKIEKLSKTPKEKLSLTDILTALDELKTDVETIHETPVEIQESTTPLVHEVDTSTTQVEELKQGLTRDQETIQQELGIIKEEEENLGKAIDVINELSDRLAEEQSPKKTINDFINLAKNVEQLDSRDFLIRNWRTLETFPESDLFKLYKTLNL